MTIQTRIFGEITVDMEKMIHFQNGIIGFPHMQKFIIIFDIEKGEKAKISWLQSIDEPQFALPVVNPLLVMEDYNPIVDDDILESLGELHSDDLLVLNTITIPVQLEKMTVNLKAPIIINASSRKACQVIAENEEYLVKYPVYEIFKKYQEKAGE